MMNSRVVRTIFSALCLLHLDLIAAGGEPGALPADVKEQAQGILDKAGFKGGLIVHLGSGDGKLTAALGESKNHVVHGLDANAGSVVKAREFGHSLGQYGRISFDRLGNDLPYIDNLVNLIVVDDPGSISKEEMMRVLAPEGQLLNLADNKIEKKPPMKGIGDWTHFMQDSTGNGVAQDTVVSPPKYLKWTGGSTWSRSHGHMGNMPGLVAAKGRIFAILDEGFVGKDQSHAPADWSLIARDAYNGILLWRKPIKTFHDALWGKKSGPIQLPERLVTDGDRVYATLDIEGPLSAVDAATGELIMDYKETNGTEEILFNNGVLFLLRNPLREAGKHDEPIRAVKGRFVGGSPHGENEKEIVALNAQTGRILWKHKSVVLATTLVADGKRVCFHDGTKIVCLDRANGKLKWNTVPVERMRVALAKSPPELLVHRGVVLFVGGLRFDQSARARAQKKKEDGQQGKRKNKGREDQTPQREEFKSAPNRGELIHAFDAESGERLWDDMLTGGVYGATKYSVFAIEDMVWTGDVGGGGPMHKKGQNPYTGRELRTGKIVKQFTRDIYHVQYHSRCYPNKATVNYLMPNIRGVEMVDWKKETWTADNWIRPGCSFGLMPSHGMIYTSPHACTCYAQSKIRNMNAVYGDAMGATKVTAAPHRVRLETGTGTAPAGSKTDASAWPTYRGDNLRTGSTKTSLGSDLSDLWTCTLGGKLTAVTVADGRLFVAQMDQHKVHAISAEDGSKLWSFTAGGRVDSPPTLHNGKAYFGCRDGYLYCLNAADGSLIWRFLAAADDKRLICYEQLESVHPVHGSVLIQNGIIYCLAGRSMFLDGGMRLYRINAETGEELSVNVMNDINPFTGKSLLEKTIKQSMPPSTPDVLSTDGEYVFMGVQPFTMEGKRIEVETHGEDLNMKTLYSRHQGNGKHIFSPQGFLDDARFHRSRWIYGKFYLGGHQDEWRAERVAPGGNMLVAGDKNIYGYHGNIAAGARNLRHTLFSIPKDAPFGGAGDEKTNGLLKHNWIVKTPMYINAMLLADKTLFLTGSTEHEASFLLAYDPVTGKKLKEYPLPAMATWDGLAIADGKLYISLKNGSVFSMKAKQTGDFSPAAETR